MDTSKAVQDQLAEATVYGNSAHDGKVEAGVMCVGPAGQLVRVAPGVIHLEASVKEGVYLVGLKPGWRLACKADLDAAAKAAASADKKEKPAAGALSRLLGKE